MSMLIAFLFLFTNGDSLEALAQKFSFDPPRDTPFTDEEREAHQQKGAVIGMCMAFIVFGGIHFPNTIMTRPHSLIWRMLLATFCLYAMFMTYIFLLPRDQARKALRVFDSTLGV